MLKNDLGRSTAGVGAPGTPERRLCGRGRDGRDDARRPARTQRRRAGVPGPPAPAARGRRRFSAAA